ncbi:hypothetical protein LTR39_004557 [Cryomyces antarcticus]|nr:hypothetical protein LTR39_004557 [Cryomyces antarcticus]
MIYQGCFSSSAPLTDQGSARYQSSGYCQPICAGQNQPVLGLSSANCYCGNLLPAAGSKVSDSFCNIPCNGYGTENCGGSNYWSVYLTGTTNNQIGNYEGSSPGSSSSSSSALAATQAPSSSSQAAATTTPPAVVTSVAPGTTIVLTVPAQGDATTSASPNKGGSGGSNTAGIAAGVVVGVVVLAAIAGAAFYFLRRRKQQEAEKDYRRSLAARDFVSGGKPPATAESSMNDSRLDPGVMQQNRQSDGSIADNQDYSRRILRVANPDDHA